MRRTPTALTLVSLLAFAPPLSLGCGAGAAPLSDRPGPAPSVTLATSSPAGLHASAVATAGPDAAPPSPFVVVGPLPRRMNLHALKGALLAISSDLSDESNPAGLIDRDRYVAKPELSFGGFFHYVNAVHGSYPEGVDMIATGSTGRTSIAERWVLGPNGWAARGTVDSAYYAGLFTLEGTTLAARVPAMNLSSTKPELVAVRGPKVTRMFTPANPSCIRELQKSGAPPSWLPQAEVNVVVMGATRAGTLLAAGEAVCEAGTKLEVWAPGQTTSRLLDVERRSRSMSGPFDAVVQGVKDDEAWLSLSGQILHFDAGELSGLPELPDNCSLSDFAVDRAGKLYAVTVEETSYDVKQKAHLVTKPSRLYAWSGARWEEPKLPAAPTSVETDEHGVLWIATDGALLRERASAGEASVAVDVATSLLRPGGRGKKAPRPAGPLCPQNLVVLYGFTKVTPIDYDFPATRKAVKGHTELSKVRFVVAKDGGERFFSGIVPDVATGKKLVALIEREVKGSKPQLVCAEPEIERELAINLQTGEIVPR